MRDWDGAPWCTLMTQNTARNNNAEQSELKITTDFDQDNAGYSIATPEAGDPRRPTENLLFFYVIFHEFHLRIRTVEDMPHDNYLPVPVPSESSPISK